MKITGTIADDSACGYYRIVLPLAELNVGRGHRTRTTNILTSDINDSLYDCDLLVVQRICAPPIGDFLVNTWQGKLGRRFVYELDDLVTHLDPTNTMAWDYYQQEHRLDVIRVILSHADAVTTTTETLAEELREYNANVHVLPNSLPNWAGDLHLFRRQQYEGPVRIVYTGGPSHLVDVKHYAYGIGRTIKRLGGQVTLTSYGHPWLKELGLHDEGHVGFRMWTNDFVTYQQSLMEYDIGIAPLKPARFNKSKSDVKVIEYWAAGVVPVVSDIECYSDTVEHGVDGFLCRTDKDWSEAITTLVEEPALLEKMRQAGYAKVKDRLIQKSAEQWEAVYEGVIA